MPVAVAPPVYSVKGLRWELSGQPEHPHWLASVCTGLSELGIDVTAGHALREPGGTWRAHLDVDVSAALVVPDDVDVAALAAQRPQPGDTASMRLSAVDVRRRADGFLLVEVEAPDETGFLGRLLRRVSLLGLYPLEVSVATHGGVVHDRLVLSGIGVTIPSEDVAITVEQVLLGLVVR
jgi:hypothetical protein